MFSTILSFFTSTWKYGVIIAIAGILGYLGYKYYSLQTDYAELQAENATLTAEVESADATITLMQVSLSNTQNQHTITSDLLSQCYQLIQDRTDKMNEIEEIMKMGSYSQEVENQLETPTMEEIDRIIDPEEGVAYAPISKETNTAGILFMHRQFAALQ